MFIKLIYLIVFAFVITIFPSCEKDAIQTSLTEEDYRLKVRSEGLEDLGEELGNFWDFAFEEYTMQVVCGCTCADIELAPVIWEAGKHLLPQIVVNEVIEQDTCIEIQPVYKVLCGFASLSSARTSIINTINNQNFFSSAEKSLLIRLVNQAAYDSLNETSIKNAWLALPSNTLTDNELSLILIEVAFSGIEYVENHPDLWPDPPIALIHKVYGSIASGVGSVLIDCIEDAFCNTGYGSGPSGPWGAFKRSFIKGAIAGLFLSV